MFERTRWPWAHKHYWRYSEAERVQFRHSRYSYLIQMYVCDCGETEFRGIDMKHYDSMISVSIDGKTKTTIYPDGWSKVEQLK